MSANSPLPAHPGTIRHVDWKSGEVLAIVSAADVSEHERFAGAGANRVPVVEVVTVRLPGRPTVIREYGVDGQLLRSSVLGDEERFRFSIPVRG